MFDLMDFSSPSSSPSSSSSSPIHPASLVDPATHSPAVMELIAIKISRSVIDYIVDCVVDTVDYAMGRPSSSRGRSAARRAEMIKFATFVTNVITRAEVAMPTILGTLAYIDRAKPHLHIALEEWAHERVFLGALICASKYLNDSTLKNVHWALCTGVFGKRDVGRIEREFLDVLDFELAVAEQDLLSHHEGIMAAITPPRVHRAARTIAQHIPPRSLTRQKPLPVPVPELEPSSPESSSSSASPRTPSTLAVSPTYPVPQKVAVKPLQLAPIDHSTLELLRSFPIPMATPVHHHGHQRIIANDHPHSHHPIRLSA